MQPLSGPSVSAAQRGGEPVTHASWQPPEASGYNNSSQNFYSEQSASGAGYPATGGYHDSRLQQASEPWRASPSADQPPWPAMPGYPQQHHSSGGIEQQQGRLPNVQPFVEQHPHSSLTTSASHYGAHHQPPADNQQPQQGDSLAAGRGPNNLRQLADDHLHYGSRGPSSARVESSYTYHPTDAQQAGAGAPVAQHYAGYQQQYQQPPAGHAAPPLGYQESAAPVAHPQRGPAVGGPPVSGHFAPPTPQHQQGEQQSSQNVPKNGPQSGTHGGTAAASLEMLGQEQQAPPQPVPLTKPAQSRIDPAQIPRPQGSADMVTQPGGRLYYTDQFTMPPPPYGTYTVVDRGSASCRYARMTLNHIPSHSHIINKTGIPFASTFQPFALPEPYEEPVPIVNFCRGAFGVPSDVEDDGPPRCPRCHSYLNPFMAFKDATALCNFCSHSFRLENFYSNLLGAYNRSKDDDSWDRPEINHGSIDYVATEKIIKFSIGDEAKKKMAEHRHHHQNAPGAVVAAGAALLGGSAPEHDPGAPLGHPSIRPAAVVIVLEATYLAQMQGVTNSVIHALRQMITSVPQWLELALILFDQTITFYPVIPKGGGFASSAQPPMLTVADIDSPFCPGPHQSFCANVTNNVEEFTAILDSIAVRLEAGPPADQTHSFSCGHAALRAAADLLAQRGGGSVLSIFATTPNIGVGGWSRRRQTLSSTETTASTGGKKGAASTTADSAAEETAIYKYGPSTAKFMTEMENLCQTHGICCDALFLVPQVDSNIIEIATVGHLPRVTGGHVVYVPAYNSMRDYQQVYAEIFGALSRQSSHDCHVKLRTSRGISAKAVLAPWTLGTKLRDSSQFRLPRMDPQTSLTFSLQHDEELESGVSHAFLQMAVLYTSPEGIRLTRVITISVPVTNSVNVVFRYAEVDTVVNYFAKRAASASLTGDSTWREELTEQTTEILYAYRTHCAQNSLAGQLILPESLKVLPVYLNAMFKNAAFRNVRDVRRDERLALLFLLLGAPVYLSGPLLYPRLYCLHSSRAPLRGERNRKMGEPSGVEGHFVVPQTVASSGTKVTTDGAYIMDDGLKLAFYAGHDVDPDFLEEVFGTRSLTVENAPTLSIQSRGPGTLSERIGNVVAELRQERRNRSFLPLKVVAPQSLDESNFIWRLVEDRLGAEPCYVEFLCRMHRWVQAKMEEQS